jgi:hypothetical protein
MRYSNPEQPRYKWKVNRLEAKVNTYFGNLCIKIFQKQDIRPIFPSYPYLRPITAVQRSILDRLCDMLHRNVLFAAQIRDRPGNFQYPVMRPGT